MKLSLLPTLIMAGRLMAAENEGSHESPAGNTNHWREAYPEEFNAAVLDVPATRMPKVNFAIDPLIPIIGVLFNGPAAVVQTDVAIGPNVAVSGDIWGAVLRPQWLGVDVWSDGYGAALGCRYSFRGVFRSSPYVRGLVGGGCVLGEARPLKYEDMSLVYGAVIASAVGSAGYRWFWGRFNLGIEGWAGIHVMQVRARSIVGHGTHRAIVEAEGSHVIPAAWFASSLGYAF